MAKVVEGFDGRLNHIGWDFMKLILKYDIPEEQDEARMALNGVQAQVALGEIHSEVFRPARKHGYSDKKLNKLAKGNEELIGLLEEKFFEILADRGLEV